MSAILTNYQGAISAVALVLLHTSHKYFKAGTPWSYLLSKAFLSS